MPHRFHHRVVVVTGGSSGIGPATAFAFVREGARIVVAARDRERGGGGRPGNPGGLRRGGDGRDPSAA
ncbi:MAG: SDR family NAD(P)-dependent oxidoreductase [Longimicrobiales bacterium]